MCGIFGIIIKSCVFLSTCCDKSTLSTLIFSQYNRRGIYVRYEVIVHLNQ